MTGRMRAGHVLGDRGYIGLDRTGDQTNITGYRLRHAVRRADLPAVAETREILRVSLKQWGVPELVDTTELLATELLTNALQHTAGGAVLNGSCTETKLAQLAEAHDAVLSRRDRRDLHIERKINTKATTFVADVLTLVRHRSGSVPGRR